MTPTEPSIPENQRNLACGAYRLPASWGAAPHCSLRRQPALAALASSSTLQSNVIGLLRRCRQRLMIPNFSANCNERLTIAVPFGLSLNPEPMRLADASANFCYGPPRRSPAVIFRLGAAGVRYADPVGFRLTRTFE